jgi:hypothetical protein
MYLFGRGVKQDFTVARKWLDLAAAQGDPDARIMASALKDSPDTAAREEAAAQERKRQIARPYLTQSESRDSLHMSEVGEALILLALIGIFPGFYAYRARVRRFQQFLGQDHSQMLGRQFPDWPSRPAHFPYRISRLRSGFATLVWFGLSAGIGYHAMSNHKGIVLRGMIPVPAEIISAIAALISMLFFYVGVFGIATAIKQSGRSTGFILHRAQLEAEELVDSNRLFIPYSTIQDIRVWDNNATHETITIRFGLGRTLTLTSFGFNSVENYAAFKQMLLTGIRLSKVL